MLATHVVFADPRYSRQHLFSYQIEDLLDHEEVTSSATEQKTVSNDIKAKLRDMLQLRNKNVDVLVENVEEVHQILNRIQGQIPTEAKAALLPTTYMEVHQFDVS